MTFLPAMASRPRPAPDSFCTAIFCYAPST